MNCLCLKCTQYYSTYEAKNQKNRAISDRPNKQCRLHDFNLQKLLYMIWHIKKKETVNS